VGVDHGAVIEGVDPVGAENQDDVGVELTDEATVAPEGIGVALGEALLLAPGEGLQDEQASGRAVEVPGPPLARWSSRECGWYCCRTQTSLIPLLAQLLSGKSISR